MNRLSTWLAVLSTGSLLAQRPAEEMFPFVIPGLATPPAGSVVDVSWLNDPPAGGRGFVRVQEGHFVDGRGASKKGRSVCSCPALTLSGTTFLARFARRRSLWVLRLTGLAFQAQSNPVPESVQQSVPSDWHWRNRDAAPALVRLQRWLRPDELRRKALKNE